MWVPRGSHFTSQVCYRTWLCETMQCCAVERILDLESGATAQRPTLTPTGGNSVFITNTVNFHVCIQKIKRWDQMICHLVPKTDEIPGKKKWIKKKEKNTGRLRTKELFWDYLLPFCWCSVSSSLPLLGSISLFPHHLGCSLLPAYCFANNWSF